MKKQMHGQKGFTIVELMIATAVFSMVLLLMATAITQIGRAYYRGAITNRVQNVARSTVDEIAQAVQFSANGSSVVEAVDSVSIDGTSYETRAYCIGTIRYSYIVGRPLGSDVDSQIPHVLWRDTSGECVPVNLTTVSDADGGQELLGENMRLVEFEVCASGTADCSATPGSWEVKVVVAYGDNEGFTDPTYQVCKSTSFGGQFCAISEMKTGVTKRL